MATQISTKNGPNARGIGKNIFMNAPKNLFFSKRPLYSMGDAKEKSLKRTLKSWTFSSQSSSKPFLHTRTQRAMPSTYNINKHILCNSCNEVPWIPIVGNYDTTLRDQPFSDGHITHTIEYNSLAEYLQPPPTVFRMQKYGLPFVNEVVNSVAYPNFNVHDIKVSSEAELSRPVTTNSYNFLSHQATELNQKFLHPQSTNYEGIMHQPHDVSFRENENHSIKQNLKNVENGILYNDNNFDKINERPTYLSNFDYYADGHTVTENSVQVISSIPVSENLKSSINKITEEPIYLPNFNYGVTESADNVQVISSVPASKEILHNNNHNFNKIAERPIRLSNFNHYSNNHGVTDNAENVQIISSIPVSDFLASVEYPVQIVQSPILDLSATHQNEGVTDDNIETVESKTGDVIVNDNPSVVTDNHDVHVAESMRNDTYDFSFENSKDRGPNITSSPINATWKNKSPKYSSAKNKKEFQIIIPYITNNLQLSTNRSVGTQTIMPHSIKSYGKKNEVRYADMKSSLEHQKELDASSKNKDMTRWHLLPLSNIRDMLKEEMLHNTGNRFPLDISLRKYIDGLTHQQFFNQVNDINHSETKKNIQTLVPSKIIPREFLTIAPHRNFTIIKTHGNIVTKPLTERVAQQNLIETESKENVYVVTPQPWKLFKSEHGLQSKENNSQKFAKFAIRIESTNSTGKDVNKESPVIYSEWPHIINSLQKTSARHELFGLMDSLAYTHLPNTTTYSQPAH